MRIVHVSADDVTGGAARNAYRLHHGLLDLGHDSSMLVRRKRSGERAVREFDPPMDLGTRARRRVLRWRVRRDAARYADSRPAGFENFTDDRCPRGLGLARELSPCDVVQLHWVSGLLDYRDFFRELPAAVPVVWLLHDMNVFTGGCHYTHGCERFTGKCGACPQLGSRGGDDLSRQIWRRKRDVFASLPPGRLHLVTPSRWLADAARRSSLVGAEVGISAIPNGLDTEDFAPRDPTAARATLGLPEGATVLLFVAHDIGSRRKGFTEMLELSERVADIPELHLLSVGRGGHPLRTDVPHRHVSYTEDDRLLSLVYSAADVYVIPSREDNLPTTVLEALSCGTPVVGFDTGGIPEMVRPGETGRLAADGDVDAMEREVRGLLDELSNPGRARRYRERCRRVAVEEYDVTRQARRYLDLYRTLPGGDDEVERAAPISRSPRPAGHA